MKKHFLLLILLFGSFILIGCANIDRDINFEVLSINDIKDKETTIKLRTTAGVLGPEVKKLIEDFHKEYPYITVEHETIGTYGEIRSSTINDINTGNQKIIPDLLIGYPDHFAEYFSGRNLVNLQAFIEDSEVGYTVDEQKDFLESYLAENRGFDAKYPTDLYGLPFNKSTEVMLYNKTAFEALYGENYLSKVPATWAEVRSVGEDIVKKIKEGKLDNTFVAGVDTETGKETYLKVSKYLEDPNNIKFYPFGYDSSDNAFITLTRQFGGAYTSRDEVNRSDGYIEFDNKDSKRAMKYFQDMRKDGLFAIPAMFDANYNSAALNEIKVLMTVGSTAGVDYNEERQYTYELEAAPIPYEHEDRKYVIQQGTNIGMLNHNNDEQKLASWLFVKFALRPENTAKLAIGTGGYLPVRHSAYELADYKKFLEKPTLDKKNSSAVANIALNVYIQQGFQFYLDPAFVGSSDIRDEAENIFDAIINNLANIDARYRQAYNSLPAYDRSRK